MFDIAAGSKFVVVAFIVVLILLFAGVITLFKKKVKDFPEITQNPTVTADPRDTLRNYYCKSSYNSCAAGNFTNDWVDLTALSNAIKNGCRFLDFEIYDIDNEPAVAVSDSTKFTVKGCYNSIPLDKVFAQINKDAFLVPMPLFLNFRIKCVHRPLMEKMAKMLSDYFKDRLLGNRFNYNGNGLNIGAVPLEQMNGKVFVIVDMTNKVVESSSLNEYVNIGAKGTFLRVLPFVELKQSPPPDLPLFAKQKLVAVVPDLTSKANNMDPNPAFDAGAQFVAMCFQTDDGNLKAYNAKFGGFSFIRKPEDLRYYPIQVPNAPPLPDSVQYNTVLSTVKAGDTSATVVLPGSS